MILLENYVPSLEGDLSKVTPQTIFSSTTAQIILLIVLISILFAVLVLYRTIAKQRNKNAGESIFLSSGNGKATFNRILLIYNTLESLPPTKKFLNRLKIEFEMVAPGDERFAKEHATWITLFTWGGGFIAGVLTLILKPTAYMLLVVVFTVYVVAQEAVSIIVEKNELELMKQFTYFMSRFRYHYLIDNDVADAIYDAMAEVPHLMQLHAKLMLSVLQSDSAHIDEALLQYKSSISNVFLKQFLAICITTQQNGDKKQDGQSLCLTNIKDLRVDVDIEIRNRDDIRAGFAGASAMIVAPIYAMQAIANWGVSTISSLQTFYYGTVGTLVTLLCFGITIAVYSYVNQMKETHHTQPNEHYMLKRICQLRLIKKFTTNYWNVNYGKKLRLEKLLKRTGSSLKAEHFLIQSFALAFAAFLAIQVVFIASNKTTKEYTDTNYTAVAGEETSGTEEQMLMIMMLTKYYYEQYKNQDILALYAQETGQTAKSVTDDVQAWFYSRLESEFLGTREPLSEDAAIDLIHQYNQVNSASTMLYTQLFGTVGVPAEDPNNVDSVKAYKQMREIVAAVAEEDPLYDTTGMYDVVEKYTLSKWKTYNSTYYHWWFFLLSVGIAIVVYNLPYLMMHLKEKELQERMQEEVIQYYSIILLLIYFENVNALTILEWMNIFSELFTTSISTCIIEFPKNEQAALQKLYDTEPFEPFQRIVENLMMVDDVGVLQAFNELAATRKSNQETRSQDNKNSTAAKSSRAQMLMIVPLMTIAIGYLVAPMLVASFKQMGALIDQMSTI